MMFVAIVVSSLFTSCSWLYLTSRGSHSYVYGFITTDFFFLSLSREKSFIDKEHNEGSQKESWNHHHQEAYEKHFYFDN